MPPSTSPAPELAGAPGYASFHDFYSETYGTALREARTAGSTGAMLFTTEQDTGDWSDAPTPDLYFTMVVTAAYACHARVDVGAGRFTTHAAPGHVLVTPPDTATRILCEGRHDLRILAIPYKAALRLAGADAGLPSDGDFGRVHASMRHDGEISRLVGRLWSETLKGCNQGGLFADGVTLMLLSRLLAWRDGPPRRAVPTRLPAWRLRRALDYLDAHLAHDVDLAALASASGLSAAHFSRAFKASTGLAPFAYAMQRRLEQARNALLDSDTGLANIAAACGFASQQHFTTAFKRHVGATPAAWRRERRG